MTVVLKPKCETRRGAPPVKPKLLITFLENAGELLEIIITAGATSVKFLTFSTALV